MPEIPAEAVQAAAEAHERWYIDHGGDPDEVYWASHELWATATVEAAAPFIAEHIARLLDPDHDRAGLGTPRGAWAARIAREAFAGAGSPTTCPSKVSESTKSAQTTLAAPVYRPEVEKPTESLSALHGEDAHPLANEHASEHADLAAARQRINRAHTELGDVCAQGPSRRFRMHIPADPERDTDLIISAALNDAERLAGEVERLRAALFDVARACGADLDGAKTAQDVPDVAALALDAARDLRTDYDETGAAIEKAEAAIARVRRLCELTINTSIRLQAIHQAEDTLAALDGAGAVPGEHTGGDRG